MTARRKCAAHCGRGCTQAEHDAVVRKGKALLRKLVGRWRLVVHDNLGWHAYAKLGGMTVQDSNRKNYKPPRGERYSAYIEGYHASGASPMAAVRNVLTAVRLHSEQLAAAVEKATAAIERNEVATRGRR